MTRQILALIAIVGCDGDPVGPGKPDDLSMLSFDRFSTETNNNGRIKVDIDVPEGVTSLQVTGESEQLVSFEELYAPDGERVLFWEDWYNTDHFLTEAIFGVNGTTALSWPPRDVDRQLSPGVWSAWIGVTDRLFAYQVGEPVDVSIATKTDDDFSAGRVEVRIIYAKDIGDLPKVVTAIESAVERWREVWAGAGIELVVRYDTSNLDPLLGFIYTSDPKLETLTSEKGPGELQLIVGESVNDEAYTLGVSAGVPGTIDVSRRTFVVLSWLVHAGIDAKFDDDEIRLMGETMAHETGHYTGMFHPVEIGYDRWDALDDTSECKNVGSCEDDLGKNLMFPYSICTISSCIPQGQLTDQQQSVIGQYIGAL